MLCSCKVFLLLLPLILFNFSFVIAWKVHLSTWILRQRETSQECTSSRFTRRPSVNKETKWFSKQAPQITPRINVFPQPEASSILSRQKQQQQPRLSSAKSSKVFPQPKASKSFLRKKALKSFLHQKASKSSLSQNHQSLYSAKSSKVFPQPKASQYFLHQKASKSFLSRKHQSLLSAKSINVFPHGKHQQYSPTRSNNQPNLSSSKVS